MPIVLRTAITVLFRLIVIHGDAIWVSGLKEVTAARLVIPMLIIETIVKKVFVYQISLVPRVSMDVLSQAHGS